jgi:hypothetical protein
VKPFDIPEDMQVADPDNYIETSLHEIETIYIAENQFIVIKVKVVR